MVPHVYLDGIELDFEDRGNRSTIGELIEAGENALPGARRFVMELWVDGERLPEWRGSTVLKRPLAVYNDFKLKTASMEVVALEGLDLLQEYLRVTRDNVPLCVSELRIGGARGDASFSAIFDGPGREEEAKRPELRPRRTKQKKRQGCRNKHTKEGFTNGTYHQYQRIGSYRSAEPFGLQLTAYRKRPEALFRLQGQQRGGRRSRPRQGRPVEEPVQDDPGLHQEHQRRRQRP